MGQGIPMEDSMMHGSSPNCVWVPTPALDGVNALATANTLRDGTATKAAHFRSPEYVGVTHHLLEEELPQSWPLLMRRPGPVHPVGEPPEI